MPAEIIERAPALEVPRAPALEVQRAPPLEEAQPSSHTPVEATTSQQPTDIGDQIRSAYDFQVDPTTLFKPFEGAKRLIDKLIPAPVETEAMRLTGVKHVPTTAEKVAMKAKGALESVASPGGAVLAATGLLAPEITGPLLAATAVPQAVESVKEISSGEVASGAAGLALAAPMLAGAIAPIKDVALTARSLTSGKEALAKAVETTHEVAAKSEAAPEAPSSTTPTSPSEVTSPGATGVTTLPSGDALGIAPPPPISLPTMSDLHDLVVGGSAEAKAFLKGAAGESLPRMVAANPEAGEAGVSYASARIAAPLKAQLFVQEALRNTGVDPVKLGAALTEDNLRGVYDQRIAAGEDPADVTVNTVIGKAGSPFPTERAYQDFLNDPATQQAIAQYKAEWDAVKDPQYRLAASIDPATPLATRGRQTGARINLYGVRAGEPIPTGTKIAGGGGGGNLLATLKRKSPFARRATGESDSYVIDLRDIMANSMEREYAIAQKNKMDNALVANGDAAVVKEGADAPTLKGEQTVRFPYRRLTIVKEGEPPVPLNANIYVRKSLAPEYRALHGTDASATIPGLTKVGERLTRASLVGLSEGTIHASNLLSAVITRPGPTSSLLANTALKAFGRADIPVTLANVVRNALTASTRQLSGLAEIGALKEGYSGTMLAPILNRLDKGVRVTLDNVYQALVAKGIVEDTVANRREFISQVGQYNKRLQGPLIRWLRETQVGPFATAGRNFNVLGVRTAMLSPGVKAASAAHAAALRAEALAGVVGVAALAAGWNYVRTGQVAPSGVRLGDLYLSQDASGRQKTLPLADLLGYGRALRVTGARGVIEAKREGLTTATAIDQGLRDIASAAISPALGPSVRFGVMATSGKRADLLLDPNAATEAPRVTPGSPIPQRVANLGYAAVQANPIGGTIYDIYQGKTPSEIASRQLTRFAPKSAPAPDLVEKLPRIVERKQAEDYIDDVGRRARKLSPAAADALFDTAREAISNLENITRQEREQLRSRLKSKEKYQ